MQLTTMSAEDNTMSRKLKFKITSKGIRADTEDKSPEKIGKAIANSGHKRSAVDAFVMPSKKRRPELSLDSQREKRQKMDIKLKVQCRNVLRELMSHPAGCVFNEPVDPVKLDIPDYFSIITKPMDLGTIKHNLERNFYFGAEDFAADVRLTFSNAMLYNPPGHQVHNWARDLAGKFSRRWKLLEEKLKNGRKNVEDSSSDDYMEKVGRNTKQTVEKNSQDQKHAGISKAPLRVKLGSKRTMSVEEKQKFRLELLQMLSRKMVEKDLLAVLHKFGCTNLNKGRLDSYIDSIDDETLWKLRRETKVILEAKDGNVELARTVPNGCPAVRKTDQKELFSQSACSYANQRQSKNTAKNSSYESLTCCQLKNGAAQASSSDISSERSPEHDHYGDSKLDGKIKYPLASHTSNSYVDSDGPGIVLNEENNPHLSTPSIASAYAEGWNSSLSVPMSPKKALRAAMLKRRFADTIFKATHQAVLPHGHKSDPLRMQREKERLEREQLEEKARIAAEMRAAEAASLRKVQDELKMQRERERAAARTALIKMERTVEIDQSRDILKDVEMLCFGSQGLLERLGLYIKEDYLDDDEDAVLNREEGEIPL